jgi:hypothetical protein
MVQDFAALSRVVAALNELGVGYVLGGSMASSAHGVARATHDFDLSVALPPEKVAAFVALLGDEFYADEESIREAVALGGSVNLIHQITLDKIDLFTANTDRERGERARAIEVELSPSFRVRVASPEDTVLRKLDWYRQGGGVSDRQWNDILGVLKVQGALFDRRYAVEQAGNLGLSELLQRALEEAGPG